MQHEWSEPAWLAALDAKDRAPARVRFYINLAAVFHNENAKLTELSDALGLNPAHMNVCRQRGRVSPELAVKIETLLGRERFPRELFNDIFTVAR